MSKDINISELSAKDKLALLKKQLAEKANKENEIIPLSHGQSALFFLYLSSPESSAYNVAFTARIISKLSTDILKKSFQKLLNQNESLRTRFYIKEGKPVQEICGYEEISFEEINAESLDKEALRSEIKRIYEIPFNLESGPVFKVYLFRISEENYVLMMKMHHICCDGWSLGILINELKTIYEAETTGKEISHQHSPVKYSDYIKLQNEIIESEKGREHLAYWEKELDGELPVLNLPADRPRPAMQTFKGATEYFFPEKDLMEKLKELSKKEGTTLFATLLSAYQILLHLYTSQDDIITGTPTAGRFKSEHENLTGYFINPVAVRGKISGELTFSEFLQQIKKKVLGALSNQELPFQVMVEKILKARDPSRSPVFQAFFGMQGIPKGKEIQELIIPGNKGAEIKFGDLVLNSYDIQQQEGQFEIMLEFFEGKNIFTGVIKYNTDIYDKRRIVQMCVHLQNLLKDISENPGKKISELEILTAAEKNKIITDRNNTHKDYDTSLLIHEIISRQSEKTPDAIAAEIGDKSITYKELESITNRLANLLIKKGVTADTLVGVYIERSLEMIIALLGIIKAGGAYVPVDPSYPEDRVDYMIKDSRVKIILSSSDLIEKISNHNAEVIFIDCDKDLKNESDKLQPVKLQPDNLAYMIYTSGSTGKPKGAMNTHGGILNRLLWMKEYLGVNSADNIFQKTSFSFDVSVWEFFLPLMCGAKLVFAKPEGHKDTTYLADEILNKNISVMHFVPSMLQVFLEDENSVKCISLKKVICSGEELTLSLQNQFFNKFKNTELHNLYGPTEAAVDVTYWKCDKNTNLSFVPIGKPVANTQIYILNSYNNIVPDGIPGELHIGGVQVARGYFNRGELTSEKFIPDPFSKNENARLYKTGDLVRYMPDGNIEYLGRLDNQIKIRGFRIELGEIEFNLNQINEVKEAVVIVKEFSKSDKRIIAFIVAADKNNITQNDIRQKLKSALPEYMIPSQIIILDEIPLSQSGKADRKALASFEFSREELQSEFKAASKPVEELLVKIWKEALSVDKIGVNDNFFELGGDSIISIQIIFKANKEGLKITPKQIFQYQTISELASVIETDFKSDAEQDIVTGEVPLTPVQHWFFEQNFSEPGNFNHTVILHVPKNLSSDFLRNSLKEIIKHHDALRLSFTKNGTEWNQINEDFKETIPFSEEDLSANGIDKAESALIKNTSEFQSGFNLSDGLIIKARLFRMPTGADDRMIFTIHHLCVDGISWRILLEDFYSAYNQSAKGEVIKLSPKTTSFKEWSSKLKDISNSPAVLEQKEFWLNVSDKDAAELPVDNKQGLNTYESDISVRTELREENTILLLKEVPKAYNTQINDILLSALTEAYCKWTGKNKLLINLEGHGREGFHLTADVTRTMGWFTSIYPVLLKKENSDDTGETIKIIKEVLRQIPDGGTGYGILKYLSEDKNIRNEFSKLKEPELVFNYLGQINEDISGDNSWKLGEDLITISMNKKDIKKHKLEINSIISSNCLKTDFTFSSNIFNRDNIEIFAGHYKTELENIIRHCTSGQGGYTPSDFSAAGLDQQELDNLLANIK